jgi:hypothetical protein
MKNILFVTVMFIGFATFSAQAQETVEKDTAVYYYAYAESAEPDANILYISKVKKYDIFTDHNEIQEFFERDMQRQFIQHMLDKKYPPVRFIGYEIAGDEKSLQLQYDALIKKYKKERKFKAVVVKTFYYD